MFRDVELLTPTIKIKVESMISADYLEMVVTEKLSSDLIVDIEQGITVCDPGACPPLHVHSLGISQFYITRARIKKNIEALTDNPCDSCTVTASPTSKSPGDYTSTLLPTDADKILQAEGENTIGGPQTAKVSNWDDASSKIEVKCGAWKVEDGGQIKIHKVTVSVAKTDADGKLMYDFLKADITI